MSKIAGASVERDLMGAPTETSSPRQERSSNPFLGQADLHRLTATPRYTEGEVLGRGGMGEVFLINYFG